MLMTFGYMFGGAWLGTLSGIPMGGMFGAMIAVLMGGKLHRPMILPNVTLIIIQIVLGVSVGSLLEVKQWQETFTFELGVGLVFCLSLQMLTGYWWLRKMANWGKDESLLGCFPGAMGAVLAIADSQKAPSQRVVFTHTVRLVTLMLLATAIAMYGLPEVTQAAQAAEVVDVAPPVDMVILGAVMLVSYVAGFGLGKWGLPAAYMVTSLVVTAGARYWWPDANVRLPEATGMIAMVLLGGLVAVRIQTVTFRQMLSYMAAGVAVMSLGLLVTLLVALVFSSLTEKSFLVLVMSWVPGSVEAMTATALMLGLEPAFVMLSHVIRLLVLHILPVIWMCKNKWAANRV